MDGRRGWGEEGAGARGGGGADVGCSSCESVLTRDGHAPTWGLPDTSGELFCG